MKERVCDRREAEKLAFAGTRERCVCILWCGHRNLNRRRSRNVCVSIGASTRNRINVISRFLCVCTYWCERQKSNRHFGVCTHQRSKSPTLFFRTEV
jgi:hypothetical protein